MPKYTVYLYTAYLIWEDVEANDEVEAIEQCDPVVWPDPADLPFFWAHEGDPEKEERVITEKVMEVLRRVEWIGGWPKTIRGSKYCPWCERSEWEGHRDDCKLEALVRLGKQDG